MSKHIPHRGIHGDTRCSNLARDVSQEVSRDIKLVNCKGPHKVVSLVIQGDVFLDLSGADQIPAEIPT